MASRSYKHQDQQQQQQQQNRSSSIPQQVTFARRTSSGRYVNYSREDLDSEIASDMASTEFVNYTVQIPLTPDNQPMMDPSISQRVEEQYVSSSLFTGGYNSVTRAHLMDKVIESETTHPQMAGAKGSLCSIPGCDGKVMSDERGEDILPCECDFKICRDCYADAMKTGGGICPGCKELYKEEDEEKDGESRKPLSLPSNVDSAKMVRRLSSSKMERRLSLLKSTKSALIRSQVGEFDHNRWLFETHGTYGYGNAFWTKDGGLGDEGHDGNNTEPMELLNKPWRPLTRKLKIPAAVISPYRFWRFLESPISFSELNQCAESHNRKKGLL